MRPDPLAPRDAIIGTVIPAQDKIGSIFLPPNRQSHTMTDGDSVELLVTSIGPGVEGISLGMVLVVDPNRIEDRRWFDGEIEYASVPVEFFDWREATGYLFGVHRTESGLEPLADRVLLERAEETQTSGGIFLPTDTAESKGDSGVVSKLGPDCEHLNIGDVVRFPAFAGVTVVDDGIEYLILQESDILAKVEN